MDKIGGLISSDDGTKRNQISKVLHTRIVNCTGIRLS